MLFCGTYIHVQWSTSIFALFSCEIRKWQHYNAQHPNWPHGDCKIIDPYPNTTAMYMGLQIIHFNIWNIVPNFYVHLAMQVFELITFNVLKRWLHVLRSNSLQSVFSVFFHRICNNAPCSLVAEMDTSRLLVMDTEKRNLFFFFLNQAE